jgi:hypothetical protein
MRHGVGVGGVGPEGVITGSRVELSHLAVDDVSLPSIGVRLLHDLGPLPLRHSHRLDRLGLGLWEVAGRSLPMRVMEGFLNRPASQPLSRAGSSTTAPLGR